MDSAPTFTIGDIPVYGDSILAPMDGYSDQPFRGLVRQLGSAVSYTEFVSAQDVLNRPNHILPRLAFEDSERPVAFQLYDDDPERILRAAEFVMQFDPDILDVNMGCSVKSIAARGAGAGLLRAPGKVAEIIRSLSDEFVVPITAKIRLGWDEDSLNYLEIARSIQDSGGALVAVHGRTKEQAYGGVANWSAIAEIKAALSIPVIGNGDVRTTADKQHMLDQTSCDAVMIGRGAIGNPWIFAGKDRREVSQEEVRRTILVHLRRMQDFYGLEEGLKLFRKHVTRYISLDPLTKAQRTQILTCTTAEAFIEFLDQLHFSTLATQKEEAHV